MLPGIEGLVLFLLCLIFCFYLPGRYFLHKLRLTCQPFLLLFLATIFGLLFFLFVSYVVAWIHADWVLIPIFGVIDVLALRNNLLVINPVARKNLLPLVIITICSFFFSIPLLFLGIYNNTILYHFDDILAISLIQELRYRFPPDIPAYSGVPLTSYHFFYDFLLTKINEFFAISPFSLHFHFIPLFFAFCWGVGVYVFVYEWRKNRFTALLAVFLTMFGGSFSYLYYFAGQTNVSFLDGLGIAQPAYSVYNPRITLSMIVLIFLLIWLYRFLQTRNNRLLIPFVLAMGMLPMIDIYAAIVAYSGFGLLTLIDLSKRRFIFIPCWMI